MPVVQTDSFGILTDSLPHPTQLAQEEESGVCVRACC